MMMKSDVLSGFKSIKVCTSYEYKGKKIKYMPYDINDNSLKPIYDEFEGWNDDITKINNFDKLPINLKKYISYLEKELNIPMFGRLVDRDSEWEDETFIPDTVLNHGDNISTNEYSLETIHTPGHASNHLCFYMKDIKCLLTGDHIMDGSTVVIAPPDGNMTEYIDSLKLLENYDIKYFAPGHGNFMEEPSKTIQSIIRHRLSRESKVIRCVEKKKNSNIDELLLLVYDDVPEMLHPIAKMSLLAHLIKLEEEGYLNKNKNNYSLS